MDNKERAYWALSVAAERIGANNYADGTYYVRRKHLYGSPSRAHQMVLDAMYGLNDGTVTPEEAMAVLWEPDVLAERTKGCWYSKGHGNDDKA